jgi:ATP-dependent helicase/nuclease subunit A
MTTASARNMPQPKTALDATLLQRRAANPLNSVWVAASAGTGKTKVLTDRVLRLLLPQGDQPGTAAHKILCLTFTKAGAGEMALRLSKKLAKWAILSAEKLHEELEELLGRTPMDAEMHAAQALFTRVIDTPGGLKIMTIHSFCQSVLGRFPLEAGLSPNFHVLEETLASDYLEQARLKTLQRAKFEKTSPLAKALDHIAATVNEDQFFALLKNVISERGQLEEILHRHHGVEGLYTFLCTHYNITPTETPEDLKSQAFQNIAFNHDGLLYAAERMNAIGTATEKKYAAKIRGWINTPAPERSKNYNEYRTVFFDSKNRQRDKFTNKDVTAAHPDIPAILASEADRLNRLEDSINAARIALFTRDLLLLCKAMLDEYQMLKLRAGGLDYDDLILRTHALLRDDRRDFNPQQSARWVQYKLDQGLDHILIDEAQDTNPEQWKIIQALCEDFFAGQSASDVERTVFTVGDEKQSIYSFQRASPQAFKAMQDHFAQKVKAAGKIWDPVPMQISFRSAQSVLELVDHVFANPHIRSGMGEPEIQHIAHRNGQEGLAELWPIFETDKPEERSLWNLEPDESENEIGSVKLARHIASKIESWIKNKEILASHNRPIRPGDILILVRTRSKIVQQISRALKDRAIPVSGLDRVILNDQIVIQDLLAFAEFALQPRDDLTLACLLKSPLIGLSEEALYDLCIDRQEKSLWQIVNEKADPALATYLASLISLSHEAGPFTFFNQLLQTPCPADTYSGRRAINARLGLDAMDAIDMLLAQALNFEHSETPSLQNFLRAQKHNDLEIKREQEGEIDAVRIMTVHGAKGLQAPIVILPDTASNYAAGGAKCEKRLLWPTQTDEPAPLWSPRKSYDAALYASAMNILNARLEEEYRRLLYVALTRAEDRLYIAAASGKRAMPQNCWQAMIEQGFLNHPQTQKLDDGTLRIYNKQTAVPDRLHKPGAQMAEHSPLPGWVMQKPVNEITDIKIVKPSLMDEQAASPLDGTNTYRFLRGNLTHKLLQLLPEITPERRQSAGTSFLRHYGRDLSPAIQEETLRETMAILDDPTYVELFGPNSHAEVPITGHLEDIGLVNGQIDRLLVTPQSVRIIDFKTNRPPPRDPANIPAIYRQQMRVYTAVLGQIYPGRRIEAYLLWTDGPALMSVDLSA